MKTFITLLRIFHVLGWYSVVLVLCLLQSGCAINPENFRSNIQTRIKEKVAEIDTIGSMRVGYLTSDDLRESRHYMAKQSVVSKKSNLGAFKFTKIGDRDSNSKMYTLYRERGNFMAETKLSDRGNTKYFFSFGVNKNTRMPALNLRVEF
jgi:hypothetical protein